MLIEDHPVSELSPLDCAAGSRRSMDPGLDDKQIGSLRHMRNLARQPKCDWSHMMGPTALTEDFGAFRYQLAYMSYALALTHVHRLPAAPGLFQPVMASLIEKMKIPDVWWEWRDVSKGGGTFNSDAPRSEGWVNPVVKDNIMYSGYLHVMPLLYNVMFNDDRYAKPGALTLSHRPLFWRTDEPYEFVYDQNSLNSQIYWNMAENGYLGVACEPYCVFQVCNQPPLLGFRLHDQLYGGSIAEEVTQGYVAAWDQFGGTLNANGHYNILVSTHNKMVPPAEFCWSDAWCGALMNAWNPEFVQAHYTKQRDKWLIRADDGTMSVPVPQMLSDDLSPSAVTGFGWLAVWASEMGDTETLEGLLAHADQHMNPTWLNGGYYYPRNDEVYDESGNLTAVHPMDGNVTLSYARLNMAGGLRKLYQKPWSSDHFDQPALDEVAFSIDLARAIFDVNTNTLLFDARLAAGHKPAEIKIARVLNRGNYVLYRNGQALARYDGQQLHMLPNSNMHLTLDSIGNISMQIDHHDFASYVVVWDGPASP